VAIEVADGVVSWSQAHYIRAVGKRFGIVVDAKAKEKCLPIRGDVREILRMVDAEQDEEALSDGEYRQLMGCLLWVAMMTRPDVAWYIGRLSQFFGAPRVRHMNAAMDVLAYLVESADLPMFFKRVESMRVVVYSDSDRANDVPTRKSVSGNVAFLSAQGGTAAISFRSKTQAIPAMSSTEAEYIAAVSGVQEALYLHMFMGELGVGHLLEECPLLLVDNESAVKMLRNPVSHERTKHIDLRHKYMGRNVVEGRVMVGNVGTLAQIADGLTKPLVKAMLEISRASMLGQHAA
jgi:hypothetical protein